MSLELPADIEPHLGVNNDRDWTDPAVYALTLEKPDLIGSVWDDNFDTRPSYFEDLRECDQVVYVGATGNLIARLEDHRDGHVRQAALMQVCEIDSLRNVWWFDDASRAFEQESGLAIAMQNNYPDYYVHSR